MIVLPPMNRDSITFLFFYWILNMWVVVLHTETMPCCMRSLIATANSLRTMVVTSGEFMRNSGWLWELELSSEAAKEVLLAVVVQSVSVRHSTRLQASRIWSTASSKRALRSLDKETSKKVQSNLHEGRACVCPSTLLWAELPALENLRKRLI